MAVLWRTRKGKQITLLNPAEKGRKAAAELKMGIKLTNDGVVKTDKYGNAQQLTDAERAWRSGYLTSRSDGAKCYNAKQAKKAAKRAESAAKKAKREANSSREVMPYNGDFYL